MLSTIILTIVILCLVSLLSVLRWRRKDYPPGPFPWPFVGNQSLLWRLSSELGGQHIAYMELSKRYDSQIISLRLGTSDSVVVSGNKAVREVLNNDVYIGRPWNEFIELRNMGIKKGITMNDGSDWKDIRAWTVRVLKSMGFGNRKMSDLIQDELLAVLKDLKDGGARRMKHVVAPAVINVLWTIATGKRLGEWSRLQKFVSLMERRAQAFDITGGLLTMFPWLRYIAPKASGHSLLVALNKELKSFLMDIINEHKENYVPGAEADLIELFLREMHNRKSDPVFTQDQLIMLLLDLFIAGIVTTTETLDFLFLNMIVYEDVQRKLHNEIDSVIGTERLPTLEDRAKMPYTEAVLTETRRQWPITPIIGPRRVLCDSTLENYRIPKDTSVLVNIYSVHMDPEIYPEPELYKPERFLKDGVYVADENLLTFGKGKRRCPGETLAVSATFLIFVGVMQKFQLRPLPGKRCDAVEINAGLTTSPKPYEAFLVPR